MVETVLKVSRRFSFCIITVFMLCVSNLSALTFHRETGIAGFSSQRRDVFSELIHADVIVPDNYTTIQGAINNASEGDTIFVRNGTYYERIVVNKSVSLIGEDKTATILDGNKTVRVVFVTASNVRISGFTIRNSANRDSGVQVEHSNGTNISDNIVLNDYYGVYILNSNNSIISGNFVLNSSHHALRLFRSNNNTLTNNDVHMLSRYKSGIYLIESFNNTLANTKVANSGYGVYLQDSDRNTLLNNSASHNNNGIYLESSDSNRLVGNNVSFNSDYGVYLDLSGKNLLLNNVLSHNQYNFYARGISFSSLNNTIDTSNTVDGKPIIYLANKANATYDTQTNAGIIYLINCNNITLRGLTLTKNGYGIFLWNTTNSKITKSTVAKNMKGIYLYNSANNTIFHDNFIANVKQAEVVVSNLTFWDNGVEGNYWSDYNGTDDNHDGVGDTSYVIDAKNQDNHPLMRLYMNGDCNRDGIVDVFDADIMRLTWMCIEGEVNYNPNADFNMDGIVSIKDATAIGINWQRKWD